MGKRIVLETKSLSKNFGGITALDNVSIKLFENEIIAIVGDNGAGKSTFIKIISGVHKKGGGDIYINGKKAIIDNPNDAKKYGIETVYQEEGVITILDAPSNIFLGREKIKDNIFGKLFKFVDHRYMKVETEKILKRLGIELKDIYAEVGELSGGQKQTVTVGRAIYWGGIILIFDEPTNNLGVKQERKILDFIKNIRNEFNISIIVISHNIAHVFELVDRIIVLRNGQVVGEKIKSETNTNEIVSLITGLS